MPAKYGLLTLSESYGCIIALSASAKSGMVSLVGDLPRGPGNTVYLHIGDVLLGQGVPDRYPVSGWRCVVRK
jgi:hypothetical protein